jgi:predicted ATPase
LQAAVMTDTGSNMLAVLDGIANLVAKSWVTLDKSAAVARWILLETIRAYALEKLVDSDESDDAQKRHAAFFRDLFTPQAQSASSSYRMRTWRAVSAKSTTFARRSTGRSLRLETRRLASTSQPPMRRSGDTCR